MKKTRHSRGTKGSAGGPGRARESIVIFGKGGIGKSLLASNLSVHYALQGLKVLHVGCDPKHDSTMSLTRGKRIPTAMDLQAKRGFDSSTRGFIVEGRHGIGCVEAGGPKPGVGCAGRGISRMLELFDKEKVLQKIDYQVIVFDVLGDVVCGGFAAPLRKGFGTKVVIVVSEEIMALYAANNIAKAVVTYAPNGIYLAGLVANMKNEKADKRLLARFAKRIGTKILGYLPRDPVVAEAELQRIPVIDLDRGAKISRAIRRLGKVIMQTGRKDSSIPSPMSDDEFDAWMNEEKFRSRSRRL